MINHDLKQYHIDELVSMVKRMRKYKKKWNDEKDGANILIKWILNADGHDADFEFYLECKTIPQVKYTLRLCYDDVQIENLYVTTRIQWERELHVKLVKKAYKNRIRLLHK